jgi:D-proline reductase (dithiol) PrdB
VTSGRGDRKLRCTFTLQENGTMSVQYMQAIAARYVKLGYQPYRWFQADDTPPWQPLGKPLHEVRLGLLSTSGAYALGQLAYHYRDDTSIREIPADTPDERLRFSHITENYLVDAKRDPACIFPLRTLRTLVDRGVIGALAARVFSCMGGVYSQRRVRSEVAPALLDAFRAQQVDAALLVAM